jgi:hypothetical protein
MIDKEKVIKGLETHIKPNSKCVGCPYPNNGLCGDQLYHDALALLKEQESVIEALKSDLDETLKVLGEQPEIVRCDDCKHWDEEYDGHCAINHIFTTHDFYCADGEKAVKRE